MRRQKKKKWGDEMRDKKNGEMRRKTKKMEDETQNKKNGETRRETKKKWGDKR